ncbi:MAG: hypothetical protein U0X87_16680 [Anaerolineales bacterium]
MTVGDAKNHFTGPICDAASSRVVGYGMDSGVQMGLHQRRVEEQSRVAD